MKKLAVGLFLAAIFVGFTAAVAAYGFRELKLSAAAYEMTKLNFAAADSVYEELEKYLAYGKRLPWVLDTVRAELVRLRAEAVYWRGDFGTVLGLAKDADPEKNPNLYFLRVNSGYRMASRERERKLVLERLDAAVQGYKEIVRSDGENFDAAYNYEYLLRTRDDVAKGKKKLPLSSGRGKEGDKEKSDKRGLQKSESGERRVPLGEEGELVRGEGESMEKHKLLIPLTGEERQKIESKEGPAGEEKGPGAGKGDAKRKPG